MTAEVVNWNVALDNLDVAAAAARSVSKKYKGNAVGSLAEYDDLYQEACILLATKLAERANQVEKHVLRYELVRDLSNLVATRGKRAAVTASTDVVGVAA